MRRAFALGLAFAAAALFGGCAAIRIAYDNADHWVKWRASSYLELEPAEREALHDLVEDFHAWHRANALPRYAKLADEAARRLADNASREDLVWGYDSLRTQVRESMRVAAERVAPLLDRVGPDQLAHIERGFADDNRKFAKEYLRGSEAERRKRRAKRTIERLEDWVGRLSQAQVERVRQYSEQAPLPDELRDRDRKRMQREFIEMVRAGEARKRLPDFVVHWERGRDPAYAAAHEAWKQALFALLHDIDRSLTPEQRARAVARLRAYSEDFAVLASRSAAEAQAR